LLSSWGVAFEAVDVEAEPGARAELDRLGIPLVPAVVAGDRAVHGWNPKAVAQLLDLPYREPSRLPVSDLARRLDRVLGVAQRLLAQVPREHLELRHPGRDRSLRQLGYHIFRLSLALRDALAERRFPEAWLQEEAPAGLADGPAIAAYGDEVRATLRAWGRQADAWAGTVPTYYGTQTAHEILERTVWHAAQHVRQVTALLERAGVTPADRLTRADLEDLPLPAEIW
jgi:uncharacterized damage-inducible protein DinB